VVQKKPVSYRSLVPDDDQSQTRRTVGDIVVVASLVDRLPNIGGNNNATLQSLMGLVTADPNTNTLIIVITSKPRAGA